MKPLSFKCKVAVALLLMAHSYLGATEFWKQDIWKDPHRGFYYYEPEREPKKDKPKTPLKDLKSIQSMDELKEERKKRLEIAVMDPSDENMKNYLEVNFFVQEKSALFADQWRRVTWQNPQFDSSVNHPAANFAQVALSDHKKQDRRQNLETLSKNWGLVYFFKHDCRFCQLQSPLIKMLEKQYGFEVLAISLDGIPHEDFPHALEDNGIGKMLTAGLGVEKVPALFMVNREQTESHLVSNGVLALEDLLNRIELLATKKSGESIFGGSLAKQETN